MRPALGVVLIALAPAIANAVPARYVRAASAHDVPPSRLYALAITESGRHGHPWPWTLNVAGTPKRYASRHAACVGLHQALQHTRRVDVGPAQLDVRWQPGLFGAGGRFAAPCKALDPADNLAAAAGVLARCHADTPGGWVAAAGCYHRPAGGGPARRYRAAYRRALTRVANAEPGADRLARNPQPGPQHAGALAAARVVEPVRLRWVAPNPEQTHDLD